MKTIDVIGMMKTVATVTPLDGDNKFLIKYGNHKQVVITVEDAAQQGVQADCCPRCGSNNWRDAIIPDTLEICNVCGNSR